jgi:hypothetical protein
MDLDDPDQRLGRHPGTTVAPRLDWLAFRVGGENEVHLPRAGKETRARLPDDQPACLCRRHDAAWQRTRIRGGLTLTTPRK